MDPKMPIDLIVASVIASTRRVRGNPLYKRTRLLRFTRNDNFLSAFLEWNNRLIDRGNKMMYPFLMKSRFQKVSDVLNPLMKEYGMSAKTDEYRIIKIWDKAVGDNISSHTQPFRLIRGTLTVVVDSPTWMQQLTFYKEELKEKINNRIGRKAITDIRFKSGKVESKERPMARGSIRKIPISSLQSKKIEGFLEPIKDDKIREVIRRTIEKALIRGEGKD